MDVLPTEICLRILNELPVNEVGVCALARCSMTGKGTLHMASLEPRLWKPHLEQRYTHSEEAREVERRVRLKEDWRQLYQERRRMDLKVSRNLRALEACLSRKRVDHARRIVELGLDVWDALSTEAHRPLPALFQGEEDIEKVKSGSPLTNLTRQYWASELLKVIARRRAIVRWGCLKCFCLGVGIETVSLEEAFASLSSFHGKLPDEITSHLDREAEGCRRYLDEKGIPRDPAPENFNVKEFCNGVCSYTRSQGFGRAADMAFYDFRNSLPHLFLTSSRRALPISLAFVFVAIVRRLGLDASPLNTPNSVTALVRNTIVNVSPMPWEHDSTQGVLENYGQAVNIYGQSYQASLTTQLLTRVARNITIAGAVEFGNEVLDERHAASDVYMWLQTKYLSQTVQLVFPERFGDSDRAPIVPRDQPKLFPLDMELVLHDKLSSYLQPFPGMTRSGEDEDIDEKLVWNGSIRAGTNGLFVGQLITVSGSPTLRCIVGWKRRKGHTQCLATSCGHYYLKSYDLTSVKQEMCSKQDIRGFLQNPIFGQFFEDAEFWEGSEGSDRGRGRFIMNKYLMRLYPGDDERGARWVRGEA